MFTSDVDVYRELRSVVRVKYARRVFLRFGINCFGRHWTRIRSEAKIPNGVARAIFCHGNELFREILEQEKLTVHDLGALGLVHDDWFSLNKEVLMAYCLTGVSKETLKRIVMVTARPPGTPPVGKGPTLKMITHRALRLWREGLLEPDRVVVTCEHDVF